MKEIIIKSIPKDPIELISIFKNNIDIIKATYSRNELRKDHLFYSNSLIKDSIKRGLTILEMIFNLQLLFGKDIYIPWIGLYWVHDLDKTKWSFRKDFTKLPITKKQRKIWFSRQVVDEDTGKLNYYLFSKKNLSMIVDWKQKLYSNNISKAEVLTNIFKEQIKKKTGVRLLLSYDDALDFSSVSKNAKTFSNSDIRSYIEHINMDECLYNIQILEDLLYIIGYIVAQEYKNYQEREWY